MLSAFRHPRKRAISIGPQSEADAREFIANREHKRRQSRSSQDGSSPRPQLVKPQGGSNYTSSLEKDNTTQSRHAEIQPVSGSSHPTFDEHAEYLSAGAVKPEQTQLLTPPASDNGHSSDTAREEKEDEERDHQMFLALEKPRVRYDVEVVTKLVIYAGKSDAGEEERTS